MKSVDKLIAEAIVRYGLTYLAKNYVNVWDKAKHLSESLEEKKQERSMKKKGYYIDKEGRIYVKAEVISV